MFCPGPIKKVGLAVFTRFRLARLIVVEALIDVYVVPPKTPEAVAVLVTDPAVTSAAVVVYVRVQDVVKP